MGYDAFDKAKDLFIELKNSINQKKSNPFVLGESNLDKDNVFTLTPEEAANIRTVLSKVKYNPDGGSDYINKMRKLVLLCITYGVNVTGY